MMRDKIIITGWCGFLGINIINVLIVNGEDVVNIDIINKNNILSFVDKYKINIIYNPAVQTDLRESLKNFRFSICGLCT
jgi:dTDP-4-dehydrorhamnose reductase